MLPPPGDTLPVSNQAWPKGWVLSFGAVTCHRGGSFVPACQGWHRWTKAMPTGFQVPCILVIWSQQLFPARAVLCPCGCPQWPQVCRPSVGLGMWVSSHPTGLKIIYAVGSLKEPKVTPVCWFGFPRSKCREKNANANSPFGTWR